MDVDHVKSGEQMDVLTMIQQMGKFQELFEFTELQASAFSGEAFGTSNGATSLPMENPNAVFPSYNLQSTVSMNNSTDPVGQPCFLPYSATGRWRSQVAATGNADAVRSQKQNSMAAMREMIYRMAAMQPIHIDPEAVKPPKRRNVKISKDPQSVAARHRRERISERIRILQRIVPGGTKMDTASMLDEAIHYVKFLKNQVQSLEIAAANRPNALGFPAAITAGGSYLLNTSKQYHIAQNGHDHMEDA